jgi:hypothetical protein
MRKILRPPSLLICRTSLCFCLVFLCSCTTNLTDSHPSTDRPALPGEVSFNQSAGHAGPLLIVLHLADGKELQFMLDTGMPATVLDKSLIFKLGKCLGTNQFGYSWFGKENLGVYKMPSLYLGNTRLLTGDQVMAGDLSRILPDHPIAGILGMDCLRHYCMQLDFATDKIYFLNPDSPADEDLGKAFPLVIFEGNASTRGVFFGQSDERFCVDTGCNFDGMLRPKLFRSELKKQTVGWTSQIKSPAGASVQRAFFDKFVFNDNVCYHEVLLADSTYGNFIGLHFLARHLVTLNFPKQTMYLQRWSVESFADEARGFLESLNNKGQLPGLKKGEHGHFYCDWPLVKNQKADFVEAYPVQRSFSFFKDDSSIYHYTIAQASKDDNWMLQKAWRTDADENLMEEYTVP